MVVAGYNSMRFNLSYSPFHYVSVCIVIFYTQFQQFSSNTINYLFLKNVSNFVHINKTVLISDVHLLFLFFRYEKTLFFKERKLSIECQWILRIFMWRFFFYCDSQLCCFVCVYVYGLTCDSFTSHRFVLNESTCKNQNYEDWGGNKLQKNTLSMPFAIKSKYVLLFFLIAFTNLHIKVVTQATIF